MTYLLWLESLVDAMVESGGFIDTYTAIVISNVEDGLDENSVDAVIFEAFDIDRYAWEVEG